MSLVAAYDSNSEPDSDNSEKEDVTASMNVKEGDNNTNDTRESTADDHNGQSINNCSPVQKAKLPSAAKVIKRRISSETSVLATQYDREKESQAKVLEQHVKMVENTKTVNTVNGKVNGKKVCWMYRRGRCRLGKKCKMYHDSELRTTEIKRNNAAEDKITTSSQPVRHKRSFDEYTNDEDDEHSNKNHKKRFGMTDSLVPSQKVMRHIEQLSNEGRQGN